MCIRDNYRRQQRQIFSVIKPDFFLHKTVNIIGRYLRDSVSIPTTFTSTSGARSGSWCSITSFFYYSLFPFLLFFITKIKKYTTGINTGYNHPRNLNLNLQVTELTQSFAVLSRIISLNRFSRACCSDFATTV